MRSNESLLCTLSEIERADFLPPELWSRLTTLPFEHHHAKLPLPEGKTLAELLAETQAEVLVSSWATPQLPEDLPVGGPGQLQYVCHLAGTVRSLIPRVLIERGLRVSNWGGSISRTISECTLLMILSALRRTAFWSVAMHRDGKWKNKDTLVTQSLFGRSVGLHGFGVIARELVPLLRPFGVSIAAYSPSVDAATFDGLGVTRVSSLEELFSQNDIVVELAPGTPKNHHIVTEEILRLIKPGGVFVNVGRGLLVDEAMLARVAAEGKIQVALDVYEVEPLPVDSPLRGMDNVTLFPHIGGPTRDRRRDSGALALDNLERWLKDEPLEAEVTLEVYDRAS